MRSMQACTNYTFCFILGCDITVWLYISHLEQSYVFQEKIVLFHIAKNTRGKSVDMVLSGRSSFLAFRIWSNPMLTIVL
jgi:hypothetical protein